MTEPAIPPFSTGMPILWALNAMGFSIVVSERPDKATGTHFVQATYWPSGGSEMKAARVDIADSLAKTADVHPDAYQRIVLMPLMAALVGADAVGAAQAVVENARERWPFPIELFGGPHDGKRMPSPSPNSVGRPPDTITVPGPPAVIYVRDRLHPPTMAWRYRPEKPG